MTESNNLEHSRAVFAELVRILKHETGYVQAIQDALAHLLKTDVTLKKPTACICLALGVVNRWEDSIKTRASTVGLVQVIVLIAALNAFGIPRNRTTVYDPAFSDADRLFLQSLGFHAPKQAFGTRENPELPVLSEVTLVYSPRYTISQLYKRNWSLEGISKIIFLGSLAGTLRECRGACVSFSVGGKKARVVATTSKNTNFIGHVVAAEESVSEADEPERRAVAISEERRLPSIQDFLRGEVKIVERGSHYEGINAGTLLYAIGRNQALCWAAEPLLKQMPAGFWEIHPMELRSAKEIDVALEVCE